MVVLHHFVVVLCLFVVVLHLFVSVLCLSMVILHLFVDMFCLGGRFASLCNCFFVASLCDCFVSHNNNIVSLSSCSASPVGSSSFLCSCLVSLRSRFASLCNLFCVSS